MIFKISTSALALGAAIGAASAASAQDAEYQAQWGLDMIDAQAAYDLGFTGAGVTIGQLDSGVDATHPDLIANLSDVSFDPNTGGPVTVDYADHGTHVGGIMVASRNGVGMHGVAYDARLAPFVLSGNNAAEANATVANAYDIGLAAGIRLFNNSWGDDYYIGEPPAQLAFDTLMDGQIAAFRGAVALDSIIVFSTGNESQLQPNVQSGLPYYLPSVRPNWLAVTAVGSSGEIASYANRCGLAADWCLAAPGGAAPTAGQSDEDALIISTIPGGGYGPEAGTSMAAPHVSGAVAVAREMFPNATGADLTRLTLVTATDIGAAGVDAIYGWGLLNLGNMAAARTGAGAELFANAAWAADRGQAVLIESLDTRLHTGGARGAWGAALGGWSGHDATTSSNEADADSVGLAGGYDFIVGDDALFGAALSWAKTDLEEPGLANSAEIDSVALAVYGAATRGALFVEGSAGADMRDYSFTRGSIPGAAGTVLGAGGATGRSESDGHGLFADGRVGMSFPAGVGALRPFVHARVSHQSIDGFAETGADVFSLTVRDAELTRYEAGPGLQIAFAPRAVGSASVSGDIAVRYDASWGDDDYTVGAAMLGTDLQGRIGELDDPVTLSGGLSAGFGRVQGALRGFWSLADDQEAGGLSLGVRMSF